MKLIKLCVLYMILLTISITALHDKVNAIPGMKSMGPEPTAKINHVVRIAPRPPGWPQMWLAREIIKSFNEKGLKLNQISDVSKDEKDMLPAEIKDGVEFSIRSDEQVWSGCVLEFDKKQDFETIQSHYLDLNYNNELHSWSLVKDNILVIIDGAMPEQTVRQYELTLRDMK
ncbi:MAG: hypothetical protein JSW20_10590 [Nitrospiraceae bacterium]|nr:MAG: hypothetical protein JSW20_10590 [Nitrospiraceae bacterium]